MKRFLILVILALFGTAAFASSVNTYLYVSATLVAAVSVSTSSLNFGSFTPTSDTETFANGGITVNATSGLPYHITLDKGYYYGDAGYSGWRSLSNGTGYVVYGLWQDSAFTTQWGDNDYLDTYPNGSSQAGTGTGGGQAFTVYGILYPYTATTGSTAGTYVDYVTVTVNY